MAGCAGSATRLAPRSCASRRRAAREATEEADSRATAAWLDVFAPELSAGARERLIGVDPDAMADTTLAHVLVGVYVGFGEVGRAEAEAAEARARLIADHPP